jgi:DNA (cytosine-5)-methyltransferase 1
MKILNLYAGIGGNRKLWGDSHEITAVEHDPKIAEVYQKFFPKDKVIVADAHEYLLEHFREYDFIWSSPPCPTHSKVRWIMAKSDNVEFQEKYNQKPVYPSMTLYQEILLLMHYFKGKWCVENVIAFYEPLIKPNEFGGHWFWSNFLIPDFETGQSREHHASIERKQERKGFDLKGITGFDKGLALRNCVEPELGEHILHFAINPYEINGKLL